MWKVISKREAISDRSSKQAKPKVEAVMFGKVDAFGVHLYWDGEQYQFLAGG